MTRKSDSVVIGLYEHDSLGRRTKTTREDDSVVRYYHDGHHEVEEFDGSGSLLQKYVYRDDIDSIAMMEAADVADVDDDDNTSELVRLFYHYDGRTNVARLTAAAQTVVESYESDPYGQVTIKDQAGTPASTSPVGNPFRFQRRRHDEETGLLYFRARHYNPAEGHWLQRDPLGCGPGANWREFCSSNPIYRDDPFGMQDKPTAEKLQEAAEKREEAKEEEKKAKEAAKKAEEDAKKNIDEIQRSKALGSVKSILCNAWLIRARKARENRKKWEDERKKWEDEYNELLKQLEKEQKAGK